MLRAWLWISIGSTFLMGAALPDPPSVLHLENAGPRWRTAFDSSGFTVSSRTAAWRWGLTLERFGAPGREQASGAGRLERDGNRITSIRPGLEEWYVDTPAGLEQGFTVSRAPAGVRDALVFDFAVRGGLSPQVSPALADFVDPAGQVVLRFSGLKAWDAAGRPLPARFQLLANGRLRYHVDAAGARYPVTVDPIAQQAYIKASNTGLGDFFGRVLALSGDTLVVGSPGEASNATGVGGSQSNNSAPGSGAVYVFVRSAAGVWVQQAYIKASNSGLLDGFGSAVAISGDTLVVGAPGEDSNATGVGGTQSNNSALGSGAAYVFTRTAGVWSQQAYLKASNTGLADGFGTAVSVSGDTIVVGAPRESSDATGVGGAQNNDNSLLSGAAYVFTRTAGVWSQQAYLKASNTGPADAFGSSVSVSGDTLAVGAPGESSDATGIGGAQNNDNALLSGAVYVFTRTAGAWSQQAYVKASNTEAADVFGFAVSLSGDTLAVGAPGESSNSTGVGGAQNNNGALLSGAAYVFNRTAGAWAQQAYVKASNTGAADAFGSAVSLSGGTLVVGAPNEGSNATGVNGAQNNDSALLAGAAYVYARAGAAWAPQAYLKASNTDPGDQFGGAVAVSGNLVAAGAANEGSNATGINGTQTNNSFPTAGAAYAFAIPLTLTPFSGSGQSTVISTSFGQGLELLVSDEYGNPVPGVIVTFTAPGAGASATFAGAVSTATSNASGIATLAAPTANGTVGGPYNVSASATDAATPGTFALTNLPAPGIQVTISTNLNGPQVTVNGGAPFTGTQVFTLTQGASITLAAASPQAFNAGLSRYVFQSWSNGGAATQTFFLPAAATATYTANFGVQHQITFAVTPPGGGIIQPATGFYDAGVPVSVLAQANPGFSFAGFTGGLTGGANPQSLLVAAPATVTAVFVPAGTFQVRYLSNLNLGDSVINLTNTGASGAGLAAGTSAATTGALCANLYAFSPDEQMVACCSCPVTPNGLVSLSGRNDLISNTLTPAVPTSLVVKIVSSLPNAGSCSSSAAAIAPGNLAPGLAAWGTTLKPGLVPGAPADTVETRFLPATLSAGELNRLQQLCNFIASNGSGFGICRTCQLGGLGAGRQ